ncbi:EAL domain-containing protein [Leptospira kmetyi]|uniref:REC domain-containing phosphodiesterase n=1 Tax=Leptospira kmetyi TaxID=408139 RepID=A0ABX4N999_9LEPT|nr:EAL domain-containing protein [Leptospira kmetyi]EQA55694.1 cyclic diguanylate phosphodiesterase (EAL) domain protein [Leptospira kmetyi serovar Malaysia str. Bejo-Iso9]PJZ28010.1 REC domain-containing phosphodiesterase [Leptospira kmetyi]TGK12962.1 EAL domain-containing protein [Leptospira kmetyi]TGK34722.1 EAL domain-containing protein [Leptospira kmetyi]TGL69430.1 EAL domain-containing protein [Leptospira kmetyi]
MTEKHQKVQNSNLNSRPVILVIDDEIVILASVKYAIEAAFGNKYEIEVAESGEIALKILEHYKQARIDVPLVICDQLLRGINGDELLVQIHQKYPQTYKVMLTGYASAQALGNALNNANLYRYLAKPWDREDLILTITEAVKAYFQNCKVVELSSKLEETYLFNRETLFPNFENLKRRIDRRLVDEESSSMALMRIESFGSIAENFGIETYRKMLSEFLSLLHSFVGHSGEIFHIYDNMVAVLTKIDEDKFHSLLSAFRIFLRSECIEVDGISFQIKISIGVSSDQSDVYDKARLAMMTASNDSSVEYVSYSETTNKVDRIYANLKLGKKFNEALFAGNIVPYFQGIYDNKLKKITKYECLARILEGTQIYNPGVFIPIAKSTGLIRLLTPLMVEKTFRYFSKHPDYSFSINISESDLEKKGFPLWVMNRLLYYGISSDRVIFEILENDRWNGSSNSTRSLQELKEIGCKIAIDDFGVEQSNFERLIEIQPNFIKIDGKFIRGIHENQTSYRLASAITEMAHTIGAQVVAEFVSNEEELAAVMSLNIDYSQGYYLMEPAEEIVFNDSILDLV